MSGGDGGTGKGGANGGAGGNGYAGRPGSTGSTSGFYGGGGGGGGSGYAAGGRGGVGGGPFGGAGGTAGTSDDLDGGNGANALDSRSGGGGGGAGYIGLDYSSVGVAGNILIQGGNGGNGGASLDGGGSGYGGGGGGGAGGAGASVSLQHLQAYADVDGGNGGSGGEGFDGKQGLGGAGGAGIIDHAAGAVLVLGGSAPYKGGYFAGGGEGGAGGGSGGAGIVLSNATKAASLTNYGSIEGGQGGASGLGGAGVSFEASGSALTNAGYIHGGLGGAAAGGGAGVSLAGGSVTNSGTIEGGDGRAVFSLGIYSGAGGTGVDFAATGGTLVNTGKISGGASGSYQGDYVDAGGAGISGAGLTVENKGSITGGMGMTQADAITFKSGANTLALGSNSSINGAVDIQSGMLTFNQAALSGTPDASLTAAIIGGGSVIKVDTGTLTLSGDNTYSGGTTIDAGTLSISTDANLGATIGGLTLAGGTLEATATLASARPITLGGSSGDDTVQVDTGTTTLSGAISGGVLGQLQKTGVGTLVLSGDSTYSGNTLVDAGTLSIAASDNLGGSVGYLIFEGGTLETTATLTEGRGVVLDANGTVQVDTGTTTLSGGVSGVDALTKTGAGTLTLSDAGNSYSGGTTISAGTLAVSADGDLGSSGGGLTFDGGTLEATAGFASARTVRLDGNGTVQVDSGTFTLSGLVGNGAPQFTKTGAGTLVLADAGNSYQSNTTIDAGTLSISADGDLGNTRGNLTLAGGTLETTATLSSARNIQLNASSTVQVDGGTGSTPQTTTLSGSINGSGSTVLTKTGTGTLVLSNASNHIDGTLIDAGTLDVSAARAGGTGAITFGPQASPATLSLEASAQPGSGNTFGNTLDDFGAGDTLDLKNFAVTATSYAGGTLTLTGTMAGQTKTTKENYAFASPSSTAFMTKSDGAGGTDVIVCFAAGTLIRTARGDVAVEALQVGDLAVTASGAQRPIRWLGHRSVDCRRHPHPSGIMPVRIGAHAIAENCPARDLLVSPGHAICLDMAGGEVLVPAGALVNGTTITQDDVDTVTYWHVELDSHDVLLAENLPAESYIDCGNRAFFAEAGVVALDVVPDALAATAADYCRPFHREGEIVAAVRAELRARAEAAGWRIEAGDALGGVHLVVDGVRVEAARRGLSVCFALPVGARDVRLISSAARPRDVGRGADPRPLGLAVAAISLYDGFEAIEVALDDPRLRDGFYRLERAGAATWRWTNGRARLPAELWADRASPMLLRIDLHARALPRWLAPAAEPRTKEAA